MSVNKTSEKDWLRKFLD